MTMYEPVLPMFRHQKLALQRGWDRDGFAFLMEMGCGKSKVLIDNAAMLRENRGLERVLIIAPKGVYENWSNKEIPEHLPERHKDGLIVHVWHGNGSQTEKRKLREVISKGRGLRILVMNVEAISQSSSAFSVAQEFCKMGPTLLAVDESSTTKNPQAIRTKRVIKIGRLCTWRRILTGTPNPRSPLDLWSQFEILGPNLLGYRSYFAFKARYAIEANHTIGGRTQKIVVGYRDIDLLSQTMLNHSIIVKKEDALDLPPKIYETRSVELTTEQKRAYRELKEYATTQLSDDQHITATHVMTQILRLHQLICGYAVLEDGSKVKIKSNRLSVLKDILAEAGGRSIVWCNYRDDINDVCEMLDSEGYRVVRYDGSTTQEERQRAVFRFQGTMNSKKCPEDQRADVFVGTPHAAGYGITLTEATCVVYYSNTFDLEKRLQSEDRAHRIGQKKAVTYIDMVSPGTVDERIMKCLKMKKTLADIILDGPARVREFL